MGNEGFLAEPRRTSRLTVVDRCGTGRLLSNESAANAFASVRSRSSAGHRST